MLYRRHFRVIVVVDGTVRMMVVVVMMMMRNRSGCVAGQAYWGIILSFLAMVMMAARVS